MSLPSVAEQGRLWLLLEEQLYKTPAYLTGFLTQETVQWSPTKMASFFLYHGANSDTVSLFQCWPGGGKTQTHPPVAAAKCFLAPQAPGSNAVGSEHVTAVRPNDGGVGTGPCQALAPFFSTPSNAP